MVYMLLAFTWWAVLLFTKNRDAFYAKAELMKAGMMVEGSVQSEEAFLQTPDYLNLKQKYKRQEWMIFGEGTVFVLTLLTGLWFINRSYHRELRANRQRRNFLLSITHELKSPIASIRLVLETLMKRNLPKTQSDQLAHSALRENERLHELVENLLLSAKLDIAYQPDFEETNLAYLLEDLLAKFSGKHPEAEVSFQADETVPTLRVDKAGISSITNNLLENAVKYAGGKPVIDVSLKAKGSAIVMEFADQGIGIPDEEKDRIFEKFYRIGSEETRKTKGTGLGLFIVREIVKIHRGHIQVLDNLPKGSVFRIELPV
jgi:signal transduction histidine kinase